MTDDIGPNERLEKYHAGETGLRPREKLAVSGASALSDCELLAVMLGHGIKGRTIQALARDALDAIDGKGADVETLATLPGLGRAKASALAAALEFGRRIYVPADRKILMPRDVLPLVSHFADRQQERFICLSLNGAHEVIAIRVVSIGLVNRAVVPLY
jgi:DNA repair protein RadC